MASPAVGPHEEVLTDFESMLCFLSLFFILCLTSCSTNLALCGTIKKEKQLLDLVTKNRYIGVAQRVSFVRVREVASSQGCPMDIVTLRP